jgi:hypothetical protein
MVAPIQSSHTSAPVVKPQSWFVMNKGNEANYDVFRQIPKAGTNALYAINAADKATSVPFIKIWKLSGDPYQGTNNKVWPALSDQFTATPEFGRDAQFAERPVASIESVSVKNVNPGGWILYRELDINITVHRPDSLNDSESQNVIHSLLTPGHHFMLEYGWVGGNNPVLGPGKSRKEDEPEYNPNEESETNAWRSEVEAVQAHNRQAEIAGLRPKAEPPKPEFYGTVFTATSALRFVVVNYNFTIQPDNQIKFSIKAIEDGELQIRNATFFDQSKVPAPGNGDTSDYLRKIADHFSTELASFSFDEAVNAPGAAPMKDTFIELQDILNVLFAEPIVNAIKGLGYSHVHLYTGVFNHKAPVTVSAFGSKDWADQPIGSFWFRLKDIQGIVGKIITTKGQITIYNLFKQVMGLMMDPGVWSAKNDETVSMPELQLFTIFNPKAGYARFQVVDRKRYLTIIQGAGEVNEHNYGPIKREEMREKLSTFLAVNNHIPHFRLFHHSSFFKDAKFEVVNDELMKSIFMNRHVFASRDQRATGIASETDANAGLPQGLIMYRSAIKGSITVIGNFAFNIMGMVWFTFGIPRLDGLFYILSKVDNISREGFTSTITLQAEGSNPLGSTPGRSLVADDWAKDRMLAKFNAAATAYMTGEATRRHASGSNP